MTFEKIPYKIYLTEDEMPMNWYNVRADMKTKPAPPPARPWASMTCVRCSATN